MMMIKRTPLYYNNVAGGGMHIYKWFSLNKYNNIQVLIFLADQQASQQAFQHDESQNDAVHAGNIVTLSLIMTDPEIEQAAEGIFNRSNLTNLISGSSLDAHGSSLNAPGSPFSVDDGMQMPKV